MEETEASIQAFAVDMRSWIQRSMLYLEETELIPGQ
jgi:hypothetical protein